MSPLYALLVAVAFAGNVDALAAADAEKQAEGNAAKVIDSSNIDERPPDVDDMVFLTLEEPPIELGASGDRVRELQATLNTRLAPDGPIIIDLGREIWVGSAQPESEKYPTTQVRVVYSERLGKALQVRGDWVPFDKERRPLIFDRDSPNELQKAQFIQLPDKPLKVDGIYGQRTSAAVMLFQMMEHLPTTGDVDAVTLDKLEPLVPTNPLLRAIMFWVSEPMDPNHDRFSWRVKTATSVFTALIVILSSMVVYQVARSLAGSTEFLSRWLFTPSTSPWFNTLREKKVFTRIALFAPAAFIYCAALVVFPAPDPTATAASFPYLDVFQDWHVIVSRIGLTYAAVVLMMVALAFVDACDTVFNPDHEVDNPISGLIGASKRFVVLAGLILITASLAGVSPWRIVGGIGAFTAIIILVFRDYLLGVVASVQIIAQRIIRIGDWIQMPKYNADGDVKEISLSLVKVQNFDKTISTIPTHAILTESFRNWSGMRTSGGRRIKRALFIDMRSIRVCTPEMVDRFGKMELIREYVEAKSVELEEYNAEHDVEASAINSRRLTNIGTFRAYIEAYLDTHDGLCGEMTYLVRHLQPDKSGLPIEIYAFCRETDWKKYEAIQADIFDHILASLPEFGLRSFQEVSDIEVESQVKPSDWFRKYTEAGNFVEQLNRELERQPNSRPNSAVRKVEKKLKELGIDEEINVVTSGRKLSLVWRN